MKASVYYFIKLLSADIDSLILKQQEITQHLKQLNDSYFKICFYIYSFRLLRNWRRLPGVALA